MTISDETLRLTDRLRRQVATLTDAQARQLVEAWARAWDEVAGDLDDALQALAAAAGEDRITRAMVRRSARLTRALSLVAERLQSLAQDAGVWITGDLQRVVEQAGKAQARIIGSQLPSDGAALVVTWDRVDEGAVEALIERTTQRIHSLTRPLSVDAERAMKRELVRGLALGSNPRETARRILLRTEGAFNGGLTRALVISRTETLDALRAGTQLAQHANSKVLAGWVWTAQLDSRSCPACWAMHGSEHKLTEPGPLGHQQCRCARTPVTKTWAELGFDLPEPPSLLPDASKAFAQLGKTEQLAVLGPGRYDAWSRGDLPLDSWARRRSTPGWRDSYVPVPVPA